MDKKLIKKHLLEELLKKDSSPAISLNNKLRKDNEKNNKDGVKSIEKDVVAYDKASKQTDKDISTMPVNKFNYVNDEEKTYHDEIETLNGLEMTRYSGEPGKKFRDNAKKAIEGDSTMGNAIAGNAEAIPGVSDNDFGKKLVKRIQNSEKKRDAAFIATYELGDKIMALPDDHKIKRNDTAIGEEKVKVTNDKTEIKNNKKKTNESMVKENKLTGPSDVVKSIFNYFEVSDVRDISKSKKWSPEEYIKHNNLGGYIGYRIDSDKGLIIIGKKGIMSFKVVNNELVPMSVGMIYENKLETKKTNESMKRLKFKKEFNGVENALQLIPESYRVDKKEFEMTDGNETYRIRWEGELSEGKAVILMASDKKLINEDLIKMKHLFNYKSEDTLGLVRGNAKIDENVKFSEFYAKSKTLIKEDEEEEDLKVANSKGVDSDEDAEEVEDTFYKADEDDEDSDKEPSMSDIKKELPVSDDSDNDDEDKIIPSSKEEIRLMKSKSTGKRFIVIKGKGLPQYVEVPEKFLEIALKNPKIALTKIKDEVEFAEPEEDTEE